MSFGEDIVVCVWKYYIARSQWIHTFKYCVVQKIELTMESSKVGTGLFVHVIHSPPRPLANVFEEKTFSTKKAKAAQGLHLHTPSDQPPPLPPAKSCPPVCLSFFPSRNRSPWSSTAKGPIPLGDTTKPNSLQSPHYSPDRNGTYFEQVFVNHGPLGGGSFGTAFKVESKDDHHFYAVKVSTKRFTSRGDRHRKVQEVIYNERLKHQNIVRMFSAWEENDRIYMKMELLEQSLCHYHRDCAQARKNVPEDIIWAFLVDLLMAVVFLHKNGFIHMDIKPDNIFLSKSKMCKLGDFGLLIDVSKTTKNSDYMEGDSKYMAPELLHSVYTYAADIFSLGMTVLELAADIDFKPNGPEWQQLRDESDDNKLVLLDMLMGGNKTKVARAGKNDVPVMPVPVRSKSMKTLILEMIEFDHKRRPTANEIFERPNMRHHVSKRMKFYEQQAGGKPLGRDVRRFLAHADSSANEDDYGFGGAEDTSFEDTDHEMLDVSHNEGDFSKSDSSHNDEVDGMGMFVVPTAPRRYYNTEPIMRSLPFVMSTPLNKVKYHINPDESPVSLRRCRLPDPGDSPTSATKPEKKERRLNEAEQQESDDELPLPIPRVLFADPVEEADVFDGADEKLFFPKPRTLFSDSVVAEADKQMMCPQPRTLFVDSVEDGEWDDDREGDRFSALKELRPRNLMTMFDEAGDENDGDNVAMS